MPDISHFKKNQCVIKNMNLLIHHKVGHPYYIVVPDYRENSMGIRVLHYLCHALNLVGRDAFIYGANKINPDLKTPILTSEIREYHLATGKVPVAVYPEVVSGNPLKCQVVCRYMLNKEGVIAGNRINAEPEDLFFYFSKAFTPEDDANVDLLLMELTDLDLFFPREDIPRDRCLFYTNRIPINHLDLAQFPAELEVLSNLTPIPLPELAKKLQSAYVIYSQELSGTCYLAMLSGCPLVILPPPSGYEKLGFNDQNLAIFEGNGYTYSDDPTELERARESLPRIREICEKLQCDFWRQLDVFIEKTQAAARGVAERRRLPEYQLQEAVSAFHGGEIEAAANALAPLLEQLPENPLPPAYLSFICAAQGLSQEAGEFIERAMEIAPERADLKAALGESFLKAGQPELAAEYLQEAVQLQPDMLSAYPALARSLYLTQQSDMALALLRAAADIASPAQADIQTTLLEILAEQGDIAEFSQACLRYSKGIADELLAARCLAHFDASGELVVQALGAAQARLASQLDGVELPPRKPVQATPPWKLAFLTSDLAQEEQGRRLKALLEHLPFEQFVTTLIIDDPKAQEQHFAQTCSLVADHTLDIHGLDDGPALERINADPPDILIDLDSYGPTDRLAVFLQAQAGVKLLWGEAPMPPLAPDCLPLVGELLADQATLPAITLPGLGEFCQLPDLPIVAASSPAPTLGCLTPAIRIGPEGWRLFAEVLAAYPESRLLLNLKDLGEPAQAYITRQFTAAGIAATRLCFVHAQSLEALCRSWQEVDLGLAPPVDAGDAALSTCLWMGRPFVALAPSLPWSHRPAALLRSAGASAWIADTPARYVELARQLPKAPDPSLREHLRAAGLDDPAAFARGFATRMALLMAATSAPSPSL